MTEEPKWPTVDEAMGRNGCRQTAQLAINLCRVAWLASVDDPAKSPLGEHRVDADSGREYVKIDRRLSGHRWVCISGDWPDRDHDSVKGWKVVYTPAAEAKP